MIASNLSRIKHKTIRWAKEKKQKDETTIQKIESDIRELENLGNASYINTETGDHLIRLETENIRLLRQQEET